jgi:hypothetical protein
MRVRGREAAGWIDYDWTSEVSAAIDPKRTSAGTSRAYRMIPLKTFGV